MRAGCHHVNVDLQAFPKADPSVQIVDVEHPVATIIQHQLVNYYHFVMEAFPKMLMLVEHVLSLPEHADCRLLVPPKGFSRVIDTALAMSEFDGIRDRLLRYPLPATHVRYHFRAGLYAVDWLHPEDDQHGSLARNVWGVFSPPRQAILRTQSFFHEALRKRGRLALGVARHVSTNQHVLCVCRLPDRSGTDDEIVYVSRPYGKGVRAFPNEDQFVSFLKQRFGRRLRVHLGDEALLDQVAMFANAKVVVGSHGAGLANFVFTQPGAVMIIFPMRPHVEFCFGHLATALGARHYVVSEIPGAFYYGNFPPITQKHMEVVARTIDTAFDTINGAQGNPVERAEL